VLGAIKIRYGFKTLQPVESGGDWWVEGEVNPKNRKKSQKKASAAAAAVVPGGWPVAENANVSILIGQGRHIEKVLKHNPDNTITYTERGGRTTSRYDVFMGRWNVGDIRPSGMSAAEMKQFLIARWGAEVAAAILRRGELATNMAIVDEAQAHHIIPVEILGRIGMVRELVKSGWDFNSAINGAALAAGFHGNHPKYTEYVIRRITVWVAANRSVMIDGGVAQFKVWMETVLLVELRGHIATAKSRFAVTGRNLNDYFAAL
jgi:hypothetical protein